MTWISVIIPARNSVGKIERQLEALARQRTGRDFEVIVADHGSTDDTASVARSYAGCFARLVVVDASGAAGAAGARNAGAAQARGDVLAFCDSDDVVHPTWLANVVAPLEVMRGVVAGQLVTLRDGQPVPPEDAWDLPWAPGRYRYMDFLPFADSCNTATRAADFAEAGGFDESYERSADIEFSWRMQVRGLPLIDAPQALVAKYYPSTTRMTWLKFYEWARQQPRLYEEFRCAGVPSRSSPLALLHEVWGLAKLAHPRARDRSGAFVQRTAGLVGRCVGSARWRVWYP